MIHGVAVERRARRDARRACPARAPEVRAVVERGLWKGVTADFPKRGWRLGGVGTFGVVACVQEVAVTPGELLADADLIHYTMGASEKDEEEAIRRGRGQ